MSTVPAHRFPSEARWTDAEFLALGTNRLMELVDGKVEVLAMPTELHQMIIAFLYEAMIGWARPRDAGKVLFAGLRIRLRAGNIREPDLVFMRKEHVHRRHDDCWESADFVVEVVSPDDPSRDLVTKRAEYAQAGIPEYWIVDPRTSQVTVLRLAGDVYAEHGVFTRGQTATSATLDGFAVDVSAVFDVR